MDKERLGTASVIAIIVLSYILFFVFQVTSEFATLNEVFGADREEQLRTAETLAKLTSVKINAIYSLLSDAIRFAQTDSGSNIVTYSTNLAQLVHERAMARGLDGEITIIDSQNKVIEGTGESGTFRTGETAGGVRWIEDMQTIGEPALSVHQDNDGKDTVLSFAYPIIDNGRHDGTLVLTLPSTYLTEDYSATESTVREIALVDSQLQYVITSVKSHLGRSFGEDTGKTQDGADPREVVKQLSVSGGDAVFKNEDGEFLISAFPVHAGKQEYSLFLLSSTADSFAKVEPILFQNRVQMFSILTATSVLTVIIASFISRNINLDRQVKEKTSQLVESYNTINAQKQKLEKTNEELKQLDNMKTQFLAVASHELKSPIQPILLYAEMAKYGDVDKEEAINVIIKQAHRLKQLSMDILDVSRIDSNNLKLNKQKAKVGDLLREIASPYMKNLGSDVSLEIDIDENTEVLVDTLRFSQVINNIIQNALKFTQNGKIAIRKRTLKDDNGLPVAIEVAISDEGPGIPEDMLPRLFGKFVTQDVGGLNKNGTGLGLYICKGIVEAHGGKIWAQNNQDRGATFLVRFPL